MVTPTLIAMAILLAYTLAVCLREQRVPATLSQSILYLPVGYKWLWTAVVTAVCFLVVPGYVERTSENTQFLAFLAIAGLAFVGASPLAYGMSMLSLKVHERGAIVCAVCSQAVLIFNSPWMLLAWVPFFVAFVIKTSGTEKWRTAEFWGEAVCFADTFAYCLT